MTDRTLKRKVDRLWEVNAELARLQEQADKLKTEIQGEMEQRAVDKLEAGNALVRWKEVTTLRFDQKAFKQAHSRLYEQYAKTSTTRRFTLVPA